MEWFMSEPALFSVFLTHELVPNENIACMVRAGRGRIEYNPDLVLKAKERLLEESFKTEVIRIMLKHPYQRQPEAAPEVRSMSSDIVITNNYKFRALNLDKAKDYGLKDDEYFEWYVNKLNGQLHQMGDSGSMEEEGDGGDSNEDEGDDKDTSDSGDSESREKSEEDNNSEEKKEKKKKRNATSSDNGDSENGEARFGPGSRDAQDHDDSDKPQNPKQSNAKRDKAGLWEEDEFMSCKINDAMEKVSSWGSIGGNLLGQINAAKEARIDFRNALRGFRASVLSSKRRLTRMKPNRRTDFQNMGSVHDLVTNLLVAVDTSGSVSDYDLTKFYGIVNKFFRHGIENIDVIQFDAEISEKTKFSKAQPRFNIKGRGGTSFQIVVDYFLANPGYDGLVIFTDGCAPTPDLRGRRIKILWVLNNDTCWKANHQYLEEVGRTCSIEML